MLEARLTKSLPCCYRMPYGLKLWRIAARHARQGSNGASPSLIRSSTSSLFLSFLPTQVHPTDRKLIQCSIWIFSRTAALSILWNLTNLQPSSGARWTLNLCHHPHHRNESNGPRMLLTRRHIQMRYRRLLPATFSRVFWRRRHSRNIWMPSSPKMVCGSAARDADYNRS